MVEDIELLIQDTQASYYDYIAKVQNGCLHIAELFESGNLQLALMEIAHFSDGLLWLLKVEELMAEHSYQNKSFLQQASSEYDEILNALQEKNYERVAKKFQNDMFQLFSSHLKWTFYKVIS